MLDVDYLTRHLGLSHVGTDDAAVLTAIEASQVAFVESRTGRHFQAKTNLVEIYDGSGSSVLELRTEIPTDHDSTTVAVAIANGVYWYDILLNPLQWRIDLHPALGTRNLLTLVVSHWPYTFRSIRVTYYGGYEAGSEPAEIRHLVADLVALRFRSRLKAVGTNQSTAQEEGDDVLPKHLESVIKRWRLVQRWPQPRLFRG